MSLSFLIAAYGVVLVISAIFACVLWYVYRDPLFKPLLAMWVSAFITFMAQGIYNNLELSGFLAFAGNAASCLFMLAIYSQGTGTKLPWRFYIGTLVTGILISTGLFLEGIEFTLSSSPFAVACAICLFSGSFIQGPTQGKAPLSLIFRTLICLNAIHFLDYPIFRAREDLAILGFTIALGFLFIYSTFVPLFIMKNLTDRYVEQLESEVTERTSELKTANSDLVTVNGQLVQTNQELKQTSAENRALVNVLVHDIAQPINTIKSASKRLREVGSSAVDTAGLITRIENAATGVYKTILHVRDYHIAKTSKNIAELADVKIKEVMQTLLLDFNDPIAKKRLSVNVMFQCDENVTALALGDQLRQQVLANILSNAIKFSHEDGEIKIVIQLHENQVSILVQDYGVGVPDKSIPQLFTAARGESTFGTNGESGTGLGLPIVYHYAKLMGGDVRYFRPEGLQVGSCFQVTLRAA